MTQSKQDRFVSELELAAKAKTAVECATAFRAATAILASTNQTWADFVKSRRGIDGQASSGASQATHEPDVVNRLLERAFRGTDPQSSFYSFLQSLQSQFEEKGYLSERQFAALRKSAERAG